MFSYNKFLEYPINIKKKNTRLANIVATQYGGANGELGASLRYLSQRYTMPIREAAGLLTDIGISVSKLHIWNETCKNKYKSLVGACSQTSAFILIFIRRSLRTEMKR